MIIAFSWKEKIVVMADSRISKKSDDKVIEFHDDRVKIVPINGKIVISHSGTTKIPLGNSNHLDVSDVINHYIKINEERLESIDGKIALEGLIDCWNKTLSQINLNPHDYDVNFLLCEWKNKVTPKIYGYNSETNKINKGSQVLGDDEAMPIIYPYVKTDIDDMTFEQVIRHFMNGYSAVMRRLDTVGGDIHIYELNQDPRLSKWINKPSQF